MNGHTTGMTLDPAPLARRLARALHKGGIPEHIARLFVRVPRHLFIPDVVWTLGGERIDRAVDPDGWIRAVYTDQALTTQRDDGRAGGMGIPTSSSSAPTVMARMIDAARIEPGHRVLEVGTGTGFNAALLCELIGDTLVTTVEIDPAVAEGARASLYAAGYAPRVVVGDAEEFGVEEAAYHRVIATCTVSRVPRVWVDQVHRRGLVVTPWAPSPGAPGGVLAVLTRVGDGHAEGRFEGSLSFMWARGQRSGRGMPAPDATPDRVDQEDGDPRALLDDGERALLLSLLCPEWTFGMGMAEGADQPHVWVGATDGDGWARLHADGRVEQGGHRCLRDEFQTALRWWERHGRPGVDRLGLTVDVEGGRQSVWMDSPRSALWNTHRPRVERRAAP